MVFLESLVAQLVKKFSTFMGPELSLLCSKKTTTESYPEPV
jgi:hypothetical protein